MTPSHPSTAHQRRVVAAGLLALVAFHVAVNVWWLSRDNAPQVGDPGSHLEAAKIYYRVLTNPHEPSFVKRVADLRHVPLRFYPPLVYVLGAFSALAFGPSTMGFALVNTFVFAALILAAYAAARMVLPPLGALFGAFTVSMTPFLFGISRLFLLDLLSTVFVVWFFVALVKADGFQRWGWVIALALINVLGFWTRWTTPLYYAVPLALAAFWALRDASREAESRWEELRVPAANLALFAAISVFGIGAWFVRQTSDIATTYERDFAPVQKTISLFDPMIWISYPIIVNNTGTFLLIAILSLAGMGVALMRRPISRATVLFILWPLASIVLLTLLAPIRNHAPRYIVPVLPALGIFAAMALYAIPRRGLRAGAIAAVAVALTVQFANVTFAGFATLEAPVAQEFRWQTRSGDKGIVVFASHVDASGAKYGPPYEQENWLQRALGAIVEADASSYSVRNQDAKVLLIGARRESISNVQRDYWPVADSLRDPTPVRRVVGRYVPATDVHFQAGYQLNFGDWESHFPATWPLPVEFHATPQPQGIAAFSARFRPNTAPVEYAYLTGADDVVHVTENSHHFIMHPMNVPLLQLRLGATAEEAATTTLESLNVYREIAQPRPVALNEVFADIDGVLAEAVERVEYVVWASPKPVDEMPAVFEGFERLAAFEAGVFGHWEARHFEVYWRRPRGVISLETCETLRVTTTNDAADGRWDIPWYRFPWWTAVNDPQHWPYWAASSPATVEADFGRAYAIDGIEILPYSGGGVVAVRAEYWDGEGWLPLDDERVVVGAPAFEDGKRALYHHDSPERWAEAITTERVRFTFEGEPRVAITNTFVYYR